MEIRDTRNGSWYWVNTAVNACPHISHADKSVYGALASFAGYTEIRPSFETIAKRSATSLRQAKTSVKNLIKSGYVEMVAGGGRGISNIYNLVKCPKGCKKCTVSKTVQKMSETVQELHLNGANSAPHIDIDRYKEKDIGGKSPPLTLKRKNMPFKRYNENEAPDDVPLIDADSNEKIRSEYEIENEKIRGLLVWAENERGKPFMTKPTQIKAIKILKAQKISPAQIKQEYKKLLASDYWRKNDRLPDFNTLVSSFANKR